MIRFVVFVALCSAAQRAFPFESPKNLPDPDCGAKCLYVILLEQGAAPAIYKAFTKDLYSRSKAPPWNALPWRLRLASGIHLQPQEAGASGALRPQAEPGDEC
jgi:hypothetical protein